MRTATRTGQKQIGLINKNNNFARESAWIHVLSRPGTQDNNFLFFSWTLIQSLRIQLQKRLPTFDELNEME